MITRRWVWVLAAGLLLAAILPGVRVFGIDQAMPADHPAIGGEGTGTGAAAVPGLPETTAESAEEDAEMRQQDRTGFQQDIKLDKFRLLAIQNKDQVKILDSWARQSVKAIYNRETYKGQDPLYTALDMALRPGVWTDQNIIFIEAVPIREQLMKFAGGATPMDQEKEGQRILETGLVSEQFIDRADVHQELEKISMDTLKGKQTGKIALAEQTLNEMFIRFDIAPPGPTERGMPWHHPAELLANTLSPAQQVSMKVKSVAGYTPQQAAAIQSAMRDLILGWRTNDAATANRGIVALTAIMPTIDPAGYPTPAKRLTELWYNRTFYGTIANVFLYFIAMTLLLLVAVGAAPKVWKLGYIVFTVAVILHLTSMGVRFWLAGRWPTQNEFESVLGAAMAGCVVGWLLETWKRNGLFGMAFAFVGFLAMTACMAAPYVFGTDLGGAIGKTAGILQTYWLYIHVNIVISSYALISATFVLGSVYLLMKQWYWINPLEPGIGEGEGVGGDGGSGGGVEAVLHSATALRSGLSTAAVKEMEAARSRMLTTLDQANMVILQMAFWFLGIGIICGAVWADHSWGRPWGWDPKETFALITWLVYLIIVHVRIVWPKAKADTTAWLSIIGFGVMMFNWIGVNFLLVGLHSYA